MLEKWDRRAPEEANHFNPAFLASLIYEFTKEYMKHRKLGAPITYHMLAFAAVLHAPTRARLPYSTVTSIFDWIQSNEDSLVGFSQRAQGVNPFFKEALRFGLQRNVVAFSDGHLLVTGEQKAHFPTKFIQDTTSETKEIIDRNRFFARWLAKSGSEPTVIAAWGLQP